MSVSDFLGYPQPEPDEWPAHDACCQLQARLEWTFQVSLDVEEFRQADTAGQLHALVMRHLERAWETDDDSTCSSLSARVAGRVRTAVCDLFGVSPGLVSPSGAMSSIVPLDRRKEAWRDFRETLDLRLPDLEFAPKAAWTRNRHARAATLLFVPSLLLLLAGIVVDLFSIDSDFTDAAAGLGCLGLFGAGVLFAVCLLGDKDHIPACCRTVADTVVTAMRLNPIRLGPGRLAPDEVWQMLRWTVAEECDIPAEEVTRDFQTAGAPCRIERLDDSG